MRIIFLLFFTLLIVSGCNKKVKEKVGIVTTGPNEYVVKRNKSLEMPPNYDLPPIATTSFSSENNNYSAKKLNEGEKALIDEIGQ